MGIKLDKMKRLRMGFRCCGVGCCGIHASPGVSDIRACGVRRREKVIVRDIRSTGSPSADSDSSSSP